MCLLIVINFVKILTLHSLESIEILNTYNLFFIQSYLRQFTFPKQVHKLILIKDGTNKYRIEPKCIVLANFTYYPCLKYSNIV